MKTPTAVAILSLGFLAGFALLPVRDSAPARENSPYLHEEMAHLSSSPFWSELRLYALKRTFLCLTGRCGVF